MKVIPTKAGEIQILKSGLCRLTAPNPGLMTGAGTNTYIIGEKNFAVIDPGPDVDQHIQQILEFTEGKYFMDIGYPHSPGSFASSFISSQSYWRSSFRDLPSLGWPSRYDIFTTSRII